MGAERHAPHPQEAQPSISSRSPGAGNTGPLRSVSGTRGMMRLALALAVTAALVTGCGERPAASPDEETFGPSDLPPTEREAFVYAAVIKHMTAEEGQSSGFDAIYVLDHSVEGAS